jgi:hypothetical protein
MKKLLVVSFAYLFLTGAVRADATDDQLKPLPAPVQKTIRAELEKRTIVKIDPKTHDGKTRYKVVMKAANGMQKRIFVDAEGKIQRLKLDVERDSLPAPVKEQVDQNNKKLKFVRVTKVTHDDVVEWEAEFTRQGLSEELLMDAAGKLERVEKVLAPTELPAPVKAAVDKQVGKGKLIKVEESTLIGKPSTYEAQSDSDGKKVEITYDADGKELERE